MERRSLDHHEMTTRKKGNVKHFSSSLRKNVIGKRFQDACTSVRKDMNKLPMEELLGTFKFHEIELNGDEG
ncbi:hypothetical protein CR513_36363, partial [Mucuna pruriens]